MISRRCAAAVLLAAVLAVFGSGGPAFAQPTIKAVASFSILADLVRQVGGDRVEVTSLVGPNGDAHVFSPTPADARKVADANLVVVNGIGLEGWIDRLVASSGRKVRIVTASTGVTPIGGEDGHDPRKDAKGHAVRDHANRDPHAWQDVANAKIYVANIRDALIEADPAGRQAYDANAKAYLGALDSLDAEVKAAIAALPKDRRKIITTHDAFGYFAKAYGLTFVAPQGVSTDAEASASDVARIIRQIKAEHIPAVFLENISDPRLIEQIARESGARIGAAVYSDSLSEPNGPAGTYIDMIRSNLKAFVRALSG
jgi:zinc/manganese transport system substrate-binding protein